MLENHSSLSPQSPSCLVCPGVPGHRGSDSPCVGPRSSFTARRAWFALALLLGGEGSTQGGSFLPHCLPGVTRSVAAEVLCDMEVSPHVGAVILLLDVEEAKSL